MIETRYLQQTCNACPSQWEGVTITGELLYIRYRWGVLSCQVEGVTVFSEAIGGQYDGVLDDDEMQAAIKEIICFRE